MYASVIGSSLALFFYREQHMYHICSSFAAAYGITKRSRLFRVKNPSPRMARYMLFFLSVFCFFVSFCFPVGFYVLSILLVCFRRLLRFLFFVFCSSFFGNFLAFAAAVVVCAFRSAKTGCKAPFNDAIMPTHRAQKQQEGSRVIKRALPVCIVYLVRIPWVPFVKTPVSLGNPAVRRPVDLKSVTKTENRVTNTGITSAGTGRK